MKALTIDLYDQSLDILKVLDSNESVTVLYRGKIKGVINPAKRTPRRSIKEHPFYGMYKENGISVLDELDTIRKPRYDI